MDTDICFHIRFFYENRYPYPFFYENKYPYPFKLFFTDMNTYLSEYENEYGFAPYPYPFPVFAPLKRSHQNNYSEQRV